MTEASQTSSASPGAPRRQEPQGGARGAVPGANGAGPAPLPVRGAQGERANPAEAVPGIRPDERRSVEENAGALPTPRVSTVRGTMGKPQLPRRRAQEHIAPQLRGGPAPRQESDHLAGHDPGLMAAFQRGIGLAETQQHMESARGDAEDVDAGYMGTDHVGTDHVGTGRMSTDRMGPNHVGTDHMGTDHVGTDHMSTDHMSTDHVGTGHMSTDRMGPDHMGTDYSGTDHMGTGYVGAGHMDSAHTPTTHGIRPAYTPSLHTTSETTSPTPEPTHPDPLVSQPTRLESVRPATGRLEPTSLDTARSQPTRPRPTSLDGLHMDVTPITTRPSMEVSPMDPAHMTEPHPGPAPGTDHTTWPDGSAPAG